MRIKIYLFTALFLLPLLNRAQITVDTAIVPQYVQGANGTNNNRTPFYCWVELSGMVPLAQYKYYTSMDTLNSSPTSNGAGNPLLVNIPAQRFTRTTNASLSGAGHDTITADVLGQWSGWIGVEATGNPRFTPGKKVYPTLIMNNGLGGTAVANRVRLLNYLVHVVNYGTNAQDTLQGSFLYDSANVSPKNFVFLYDNTAGTGRPIAGAVVEKEGIDQSVVTSIVAAYRNNVDTTNFRWGTIIPNDLPDGIRRVEYRDLTMGSILGDIQDADGNWCYLNTVNPVNGSTAARLRSLENTGVMGYLDTDNDTYGDPATATLVPCNTPGYVTDSTDCDDTDANINPGAQEICDALDVDEDCDGMSDDADLSVIGQSTWYEDFDTDTYGNSGVSLQACDAPQGYVAVNTDCNDSNANVHPGATEICNNIDDDCDQQIDDNCTSDSEMDVSENSNNIAHNGTYNFGSVVVGSNPTVTLDIDNNGTDTLFFSPMFPAPSFTGPYAATGSLPAFVLPGASTSWTIECTVSVTGAANGSVSIPNSDANERPYVINFTATGILSTESYISGVTIDIFPSPATDKVNLGWEGLSAGTEYMIAVTDISGRQVMNSSFTAPAAAGQTTLDVSSLSSGVYMVQLTEGETRLVSRSRLVKE